MRRVWTTVALVLLLSARRAAPWPLPENVSQAFDCDMRKAAYAYGKKLVPRMGSFESLYYALDLNNESCKVPLPPPSSGVDSSSKGRRHSLQARSSCLLRGMTCTTTGRTF